MAIIGSDIQEVIGCSIGCLVLGTPVGCLPWARFVVAIFWRRNKGAIPLMAEIRRSPVEVGSLSRYLQGFSTIQTVVV